MYIYQQGCVRSGSVVECLTPDWRVAGFNLIGGTALCPWARHINLCLVLVQPRKYHPDMSEKMLTRAKRIKSNKQKCINKAHAVDEQLFDFMYTHSWAVTKTDSINSNVHRTEHSFVTSSWHQDELQDDLSICSGKLHIFHAFARHYGY